MEVNEWLQSTVWLPTKAQHVSSVQYTLVFQGNFLCIHTPEARTSLSRSHFRLIPLEVITEDHSDLAYVLQYAGCPSWHNLHSCKDIPTVGWHILTTSEFSLYREITQRQSVAWQHLSAQGDPTHARAYSRLTPNTQACKVNRQDYVAYFTTQCEKNVGLLWEIVSDVLCEITDPLKMKGQLTPSLSWWLSFI